MLGAQCALSHLSKTNALCHGTTITVILPRRKLRPRGYVTCASPHSHFFWQSQDKGSCYFEGCHFSPSLGSSCEGATPIPILEFPRGSPTSHGAVSHCGPRCDALDAVKGAKALSMLTQPFSPLTPARGSYIPGTQYL